MLSGNSIVIFQLVCFARSQLAYARPLFLMIECGHDVREVAESRLVVHLIWDGTRCAFDVNSTLASLDGSHRLGLTTHS
jgi:hypothetical protein